ncbi:MAG TPA: crosslink repair DNA glycosylase YcaQ family protein [Jiangellaceae bacterium]|nr:crosslink repair DNA glycosylase YcaQ family protein [Jiangellaceae bacterium]
MSSVLQPLAKFILLHNNDAMGIDELIAGGEALTVEFKRQAEGDELVRAVTCLANGEGGVLLIGVDDDGAIVGARGPRGEEPDPIKIAAFVQNKSEPPLPVRASVEQVDEKAVVRIDVPRADPGPVGTKGGLYLRRVLDSKGAPMCSPMTPHEIVSMGMVTRGQDYAASPALDATEDDLDPAEFDRFRSLCRESGDAFAELSDRDLLRALGLVSRTEPVSLGALLLFGTEGAIQRWVPSAEVMFHDSRERPNSSSQRLTGGLLRMATRLNDLLELRASVTELYVGLHRVEVPLISASTRRESLANALIHRDYSVLGPTTVQLADSEFSVTSGGGLPPGVTVSTILTESRPRSPTLAEAFRRAGLVERRGKGVNEMFESQLRAGRDAPDYSRTTSSSVTVAVPLGTVDIDLVRFLVTFENAQQEALSLAELRIVHEVRASGPVTPTELVEVLGVPVASVRATASRLVEKGLLESRGAGRNRQFHLTARFYDLAEDRNAYVRVKGADPLQQQRMVMDYVQAYGHITRSLAASLCQTTPVEARKVLKGLVDERRLQLVGEKRGSRYVLPE